MSSEVSARVVVFHALNTVLFFSLRKILLFDLGLYLRSFGKFRTVEILVLYFSLNKIKMFWSNLHNSN